MKLIINDKEKRIYQDDNKIYTLINMGAYVGYKTRDLFKETKDFWKLISYEDKSNKNGKLCIDTIINDEGHYVRIKMDKGEVSRYICLLDENIVISDNLHDKQTNRDVLSTNDLYSAFGKDIYNKNMDPFHKEI